MQPISFMGLQHHLWSKSLNGATSEDIAIIVNDAKLQASKLYVTKGQVVKENEPEYFDSNQRFTQAGVEALKSQALYSPTGKIETAKELRDALVNRTMSEIKDNPEDSAAIIENLHRF